MLERKHKKNIERYLKQKKQALLVSGARQVGKTFLIRETLKQSGIPYTEFNLIDQPEVAALFKQSRNAEDFLQRLRLTVASPLEDDSILFFDEIQEAEDVFTLIKFLVDDGSFRYVFSGSLLGVELKDFRSAPVGYLHEITMFPLDFEEFLMAVGVQKKTCQMVEECFKKKEPLEEFVHEKLIELFYLYLIIGGMPQAVQTYVDTHDIRLVTEIHHDIVSMYKRDFTKNEKRDKLKLIAIYDAIPGELNKQNKRFVFTYLDKQLKFDRYENSFLWLKDAGVALPVYNVQAVQIPLMQSSSTNLFKLYMNDVGLLNSFYGNHVKLKIMNRDKDINNGALFENAVAQLLVANGCKVYYYRNSKSGEVDFVIEKDGHCVPVEVKSGKSFRSHRALNNLMSRKDHALTEAYVFSDANVSSEGRIHYLPVYMAGLLKDSPVTDAVVIPDLSGM